MQRKILCIFCAFLFLAPLLGQAQSRPTSKKTEIVFSSSKSRYRFKEGYDPRGRTRAHFEEEEDKKLEASTSSKSTRRYVLPKSLREKWENKPQEIEAVVAGPIELTTEVEERIIETQDITNLKAIDNDILAWEMKIFSLVEEVGEARTHKPQPSASEHHNSMLKKKQDTRVWAIVDSILSVDGGKFPGTLIDELEMYAETYAKRDMATLNIPQRKIHDVVHGYRYQEKLPKDLQFQGSWWSAKPFKATCFNPNLVAKINLPLDVDGTYGCSPLKNSRETILASNFGHRNSSGAWYSEITGTMEIGGQEDVDGFKKKEHSGIDFRFDKTANGYKKPDIHAWRSGVVVYSSYNVGKNGRGYGHVVIIEHGRTDEGLPLVSVYAHLSLRKVKVGDLVRIGDVIGIGGTSGARAPHLHFEICLGDMPLDPEAFLNLRRPTGPDVKMARQYHEDTPLYGMAGGNYIVFPQGNCKNNVCARYWTYTTAPAFAVEDVGEKEAPNTEGLVLRRDVNIKQRILTHRRSRHLAALFYGYFF